MHAHRLQRFASLLVCFLLLSGCAAPRTQGQPVPETARRPDAFVIEPFVNSVTGESAVLAWVSEAGVPAGEVRIAARGRRWRKDARVTEIAGEAAFLHSATLRGLRPGMHYEYAVRCGERRAVGSFGTPPPAGKRLRFVVYGDSRSRPSQHYAVSLGIAREDPLFVVHVGDLVNDGRRWQEWPQQFFGPARPYLAGAAIWPVRGNHEKDAVLYRNLFELPGNELWYSFDAGNVHCIVLDSEATGEQRRAMRQWLEKDLEDTESTWTLVAYHVPTFNVAGHGSSWGREDILPVLERHGVDMVLNGHSHLYERFRPIGPPGGKPLIHVVTGGAGAPLRPARPSPLLVGGTGHSLLHYCLFEVHGNRLRMTVKEPDGSVVDRVRLVKNDGVYQEEVMNAAVSTGRAIELLKGDAGPETATAQP